MKKTSDTHQTIRLPKHLIVHLRAEARAQNRSLANMAEVAIWEWLKLPTPEEEQKDHNAHLGSNKE